MALFSSFSASDSSSAEPHQQHEVFISFRGSDTRFTFTSHLRKALSQRKIVTFIDNELQRGDEISPALSNAIEKSKVAIVIFSEDYASSKWCLNELVEILECKKGHGQIVIPIFYHVNPTDVRKQTESYERSFAEHEKKGVPVETLQKWRIALTEASNLSGWDATVVRDEALLTEGIVDDIWNKLSVTYKIDNKNLLGIEPKVEKIESLLNMGSGDVCVVGIWGFGGIGKTTLASAVFNKIRTHFEGSCFLRNIREESGKAGGLNLLRQQLYSDIWGEESGKIVGMRVRLDFVIPRMKVLIVFDDVTDVEQITNIIGDLNWSNRESRFIITARDKQVLRNCECKEEKIYKVNGLCDQEAHQLFSRFAFKLEHPLEDYTELSRNMVDHAKGSPLALKVLGSSLFGKSKPEWESAMKKLKRTSEKKIQDVLRVSYDGLDYEQRNLFLDVACLFKGKLREDMVDLHDAETYSIEITLSSLIDRCLVSVDLGFITMHDLVQQMGWQIIREQSIENPGERSRLWDDDDIYQVLTKNQGTRAIKSISLDMSKTRTVHLNKNSFTKISELWYLNICSSDYSSSWKTSSCSEDFQCALSCSEDFQCASTKLRVLCWDYYPLKSLQSRFSLENLVVLRMWHSKVEQLWNGVQPLPNLKEIDFSYSPNVTAIPDLSLAPKLEKINLSYCRNLKSFPPCDHLKSLRKLNLSNCEKLVAIPELSCSIRELNLSGTGITCLPSSIGNQSQLLSLRSSEHHIVETPDTMYSKEFSDLEPVQILRTSSSLSTVFSHLLGLSNLEHLDLSDWNIVEVPDSICQCSSLKSLLLCGNHFEKLPENIIRLSKLETLNLTKCRKLQFLPELPRSLTSLSAKGCSSLKAVPNSLSTLLATTTWAIFTGCYMLDKDAFTTIVQNALLEIQRRFRERPAQAIEEHEDGRDYFDLHIVEYSGYEIPEIFEFQELGSVISEELSHDMIGGKFVGFACYVVYTPLQHDDMCLDNILAALTITLYSKTTLENGESFLLADEFRALSIIGISEERGEDDSKVVVVGYIPKFHYLAFPSQYRSILLQMEFSFHCDCEIDEYIEIEECGFHLFSTPVPEEERKGTSIDSINEEKQLESSPKRRKIS